MLVCGAEMSPLWTSVASCWVGNSSGVLCTALVPEEMGSEASELIEFHITGFRKFHLVPENPTEILVGKIEEYSRKHGMAPGTQLGSCTVLETAGKGALDPLLQLLSSSHEEIEKPLIMSAGASGDVKLGGGSLSVPPKRIVWVRNVFRAYRL